MIRRIAIVTGASRLKGIGRAICVELAKRGNDIFFTYWTNYDNGMPWKVEANEPDLIQQEIRNLGVKCEKIELDLSTDDAYLQLFDEVENKLGNPSILINNAAYSTQTGIDNFTAIELDRHYKVNIKATTLLSIEFIRRFKGNSGGRIINLSSGQTLGPMPNEIAYALTKGAIETFTKTIFQEIASKGITINAVNPGVTDTGWIDKKTEEVLLKCMPLGRFGTPEDAAKLIGFLASEEAEWITGQIINSEGGFMRSN